MRYKITYKLPHLFHEMIQIESTKIECGTFIRKINTQGGRVLNVEVKND